MSSRHSLDELMNSDHTGVGTVTTMRPLETWVKTSQLDTIRDMDVNITGIGVDIPVGNHHSHGCGYPVGYHHRHVWVFQLDTTTNMGVLFQ